MLSERLQATLCKKKSCAVFFNTLGTTLHRSKPYAILPERFQTTSHKKKYCAILSLILQGQHCTGQNPIPCYPRCSRQHCIRENLFQCRLNTLGTTLHRENYIYIYIRLILPLLRKSVNQLTKPETVARHSTQQPVKLLVGRYLSK